MSNPRNDLVSRVAFDLGLNKTAAKRVINTVIGNIKELAFSEGSVTVRDFGKFAVRHRAARVVKSGVLSTPVNVPARKALTFTCSKKLVCQE